MLLYTNFATMLGLLYSFLPFMVLPLYASLEKMDFRLVEAGFDLYATRGKVLRRIIIPLAKPGIVAGCLLVFIPAIGAYVTPLHPGRRQASDDRRPDRAAVRLRRATGRWARPMALILMAVVMIALIFYVRTTTGKAPGTPWLVPHVDRDGEPAPQSTPASSRRPAQRKALDLRYQPGFGTIAICLRGASLCPDRWCWSVFSFNGGTLVTRWSGFGLNWYAACLRQ